MALGLVHIEQFVGIQEAQSEVGELLSIGAGQRAGGGKFMLIGGALEEVPVEAADLFVRHRRFLGHASGEVLSGLADEFGI